MPVAFKVCIRLQTSYKTQEFFPVPFAFALFPIALRLVRCCALPHILRSKLCIDTIVRIRRSCVENSSNTHSIVQRSLLHIPGYKTHSRRISQNRIGKNTFPCYPPFIRGNVRLAKRKARLRFTLRSWPARLRQWRLRTICAALDSVVPLMLRFPLADMGMARVKTH